MPGYDVIPDEDKEEFRARFRAGEGCRWCAGLHPMSEDPLVPSCPRVKRMVFHPTDGRQLREIEFWGDWDSSDVVFPGDVV